MVGACLRECTAYSGLPVRFEFGCAAAVRNVAEGVHLLFCLLGRAMVSSAEGSLCELKRWKEGRNLEFSPEGRR